MKKNLSTIIIIFFLLSCQSQKQTTTTQTTLHYKGYRIEDVKKTDSNVVNMLAPYAKTINSTMNTVIGFSTKGLTKKQPESELGNFMTDCMKAMAEKKFGKHVDAAFVNYGGIRSYIPKGDISIGKIYELMPFDNLLVLQDLKGSVLLSFLNKIVERGSWPQSGLEIKLKDKKIASVTINGKPIEENTTYTIANTDYIANGGDDCEMLKGIPMYNIGLLLRDIIIEFVQQLTKEGKPIDWKLDGRTTY